MTSQFEQKLSKVLEKNMGSLQINWRDERNLFQPQHDELDEEKMVAKPLDKTVIIDDKSRILLNSSLGLGERPHFFNLMKNTCCEICNSDEGCIFL